MDSFNATVTWSTVIQRLHIVNLDMQSGIMADRTVRSAQWQNFLSTKIFQEMLEKRKRKKKNQIKQTGFQLFWFDQTLNDSSHIRPHISDAKPDSSSFKSETDFGKCSENKPFIMAAHCAPPHCDYLAGVVQLKKLEISGSDLPEATRLHRNWGQFKSKRDSNWYYIKNNIDWLHHSDHQHLSSLKGRSWQQPISTQLNDPSPFHWLISVR